MIEINNLKVTRTKDFCLRIESLIVKSNCVTILKGGNGSGKTTLLESILNLIKIDSGVILINKNNIRDKEENWKDLAGSYLNEDYLIGFLTPLEYFGFIGKLKGIPLFKTKKFIDQFEDFLTDECIHSKNYIRNLSKGQKAKIGIVASFIGKPAYIFLDEPFANLDMKSLSFIAKFMSEYVLDEKSIVLSTHIELEFDANTDIIFLEEVNQN